MEKKLSVSVVLFLLFVIVFVGFMLKAEASNITALREEYPELKEEAFSYRMDAFKIWAVRMLLSFLIPFLILYSGLAQKLSLSVGKGSSLFLSGLLFGLTYFALVYIINLPLSFYSSFILRHKYGLTDQTVWRWLELSLKGFLLNNGLMALFIWFPYWLIRNWPESWWWKAGLAAIPIIIIMVFVTPLVIDPIFSKYTPLKEGELRNGIQQMLDKGGIENAEIYVVDKSRDTKTMNAYMTGIMSSKRIVLWDTTVNNLSDDEILSITAHEIGHYVKNHIWKSIGAGIVGAFLILYLVHISSLWVLKASGGAFGFKNMGNLASLPLLLLMLSVFSWLGQPASNAVSRYFEREADLYEISMTQDREAAVSAMEKLYETSLGLPRPSEFYKFWYHTHPTLEERIEFYTTHKLDETGF